MVIAAPALNFQPKQATLPVKSFLQRLLLITNGKINDIIRAYSGEAIEIVKLAQKPIFSNVLNVSLDALNLKSEQEIIESSIVFQGVNTKTNYLHATSCLVLERLDPKIRHEFIGKNQAIEQLFAEYNIETCREIIDCGIELAGDLAEYFDVEPNTKMIYRTYLVLINGSITMQVTERFPINHFIE